MALPNLSVPRLTPPVFPPMLPERWQSVALLTPFTDDQLIVASVSYDWAIQTMRITCYGLEEGFLDFLVTPTGLYVSLNPSPVTPQWHGPFETPWQVPSPDWLNNKGCQWKGNQTVLGTEAQWWVSLSPCTNCYEDPTSPKVSVGNWFWFRNDTQMLWRIMSINASNPYKLPVLGEFAMAHLPTFEPGADTALPELVLSLSTNLKPISDFPLSIAGSQIQGVSDLLKASQSHLTEADRAQVLATIQTLIPGLSYPPGDVVLPSWPLTLYMTAITIPTAGTDPLPTEIYYDWNLKRQLTRLYQLDCSVEDLILTDSETYGVDRYPDGTHRCEPPSPPGLPYPNWPTRDQGKCRGVIANNPDLSPGKTTQLIVLPSNFNRVFWIWYTTDNMAVMFMEVPQLCDVSLVLIDYYDVQLNAPIDPNVLTIPPDCISKQK